jgi:hypothetical protein
LSPRDAAAIYGEIARFGFASFQLVPGGAQFASADGISVLTLTGGAWNFQEDLSRSVFEQAVDKMEVSVGLLMDKLPPRSLMVQHHVDLHATWALSDRQDAAAYVMNRFLRPEARRVADEMPGLEFNGGGIRLTFLRPHPQPLPGGITVTGGGAPADAVDVTIEPLYADKTKLFLRATGTFLSTDKASDVTASVKFVRGLLWENLASSIRLDAGGGSQKT